MFSEAFDKIFSAGLSKLHSTCPEDPFRETRFSKNYGFRKLFGPVFAKRSDFLRNRSFRVGESASAVSSGSFRRKVVFHEIYFGEYFQIWAKSLRHSSLTFQ